MAPAFLGFRGARRIGNRRGLADRSERIAELVRERREEEVFSLVGLAQGRFGTLSARDLMLCRLVKARVVHGNCGLRRDTADDAFGPLSEHAYGRMAEKQPAEHVSRA